MFIEQAPYYSYLLFFLSIAVLGFSAGVFCAPSKCKPNADDPAAGLREEQSADRPEQDERRRIDDTSSCKLRDQELIMSTSKAKVDHEKRLEELHTEKAKVLDMERREEGGVMQKEDGGLKRIKEGKGLKKPRDVNPRPIWLRSLSVGKRSGQDSNPGRQSVIALHESKAEGEKMERKASLTGEEVKELADAFIARVRQRMRVQRQESLARQASFEARLDRSS